MNLVKNNMIRRELKVKGRITALLLCVFLVCLCVFGMQYTLKFINAETPALSEVSYQDRYEVGYRLPIQKASLTFEGKEYATTHVVHRPDGTVFDGETLLLNIVGCYRVAYHAVIDGKNEKREVSFYADSSLVSVSSAKSSFNYGVDQSEYETGLSGLNVNLAQGDTFYYNDIIDLNEIATDKNIFKLYIAPSAGIGTRDANRLIITLTDIDDPTNALTVWITSPAPDYSESHWYMKYVYFAAGGTGQLPSGWDAGAEKLWVNSNFGASAQYSFYGTQNFVSSSPASSVGKEFLSIGYDPLTKTVKGNDTFVVDLDSSRYFSNPWGGFSSGKVYLSVKADQYVRSQLRFSITEIAGQNIGRPTIKDENGPVITVDTEGLDANALPSAYAGLSYPVFGASAYDRYCGEVDVTPRVYYNYNGKKIAVSISDEWFKTEKEGMYTIEYKAADYYGNVTSKLYTIRCLPIDAVPEIKLIVNDGTAAKTGVTGKPITVAETTVTGGTVKTNLDIKAVSGSEMLRVNGGQILPLIVGIYDIVYTATDFVGQEKTYRYTINIKPNPNPVFFDEAILPRYFIAGEAYKLPDLYANDLYVHNDRVRASIKVIDGESERILTNNQVILTPDGSGNAKIIYVAKSKTGTTEKLYTVRVISTKDNGRLNMARFFDGKNMTALSASTDGIVFNSDTATASELHFVNPLLADTLNLIFSVPEPQNNFNSLKMVLCDSLDPSISFTAEFRARTSSLYINGSDTQMPLIASLSNGLNFNLTYDDINRTLREKDGESTRIKSTSNLADFNGFPSGKVYLSFYFSEARGNAGVMWKRIANQPVSSVASDIVSPRLYVSGAYKSMYSLGETAVIYSGIAVDVLEPDAEGQISVLAPDGKYAMDKKGQELKNVPIDKSYELVLTQYGKYLVTYIGKGNESPAARSTEVIIVKDTESPVISVSGSYSEKVLVGTREKIHPATVTDNMNEGLSYKVLLTSPDGKITSITGTKEYVISQQGLYTLSYFAIDKSGNTAIITYKILACRGE